MRVLIGFAEGVTFPCMHQIQSRWVPPLERSTVATFLYAGMFLGMVIAMSTCGILAENYGWESVFYIFGAIGCAWYVLWLIIARENPEKDSHISDEEKRYIIASLRGTGGSSRTDSIPWYSILTSSAVWAIAAAHFCENWGGYTLLTQLPTFIRHSLGFDLSNSGFIAAVPYVSLIIFLPFTGYIADWVQKIDFLSTTQVRKYSNCTAFLVQMSCMLLAAYIRNRVLVIVFITIGSTFGSLAICGCAVNHLDIAPQYASILLGFTNTVAAIPGIVSPLIAGFIVTEQTNADQWKWIFILSASVYLLGCLLFGIFASGKLQPWAKISNEDDEKISDKSGKI